MNKEIVFTCKHYNCGVEFKVDEFLEYHNIRLEKLDLKKIYDIEYLKKSIDLKYTICANCQWQDGFDIELKEVVDKKMTNEELLQESLINNTEYISNENRNELLQEIISLVNESGSNLCNLLTLDD